MSHPCFDNSIAPLSSRASEQFNGRRHHPCFLSLSCRCLIQRIYRNSSRCYLCSKSSNRPTAFLVVALVLLFEIAVLAIRGVSYSTTMKQVSALRLKSEKDVKYNKAPSPARNASASATSGQSSVSIDVSSCRRPLKLMSSNIGSSHAKMESVAFRSKASGNVDVTSSSDRVSRRAASHMHDGVFTATPLDHRRKSYKNIFDQSAPKTSEQKRACGDVSEDQTSSSRSNSTISSATKHGARQSCMYCKPSVLKSVCFIDNSGKIAAAVIPGSAFVHDHRHHHSPERCGFTTTGDSLVLSSALAKQGLSVSRKSSHFLKSMQNERKNEQSDAKDDTCNVCQTDSNEKSTQSFVKKLDIGRVDKTHELSGIQNVYDEGCATLPCTTPSAIQVAENNQNSGADDTSDVCQSDSNEKSTQIFVRKLDIDRDEETGELSGILNEYDEGCATLPCTTQATIQAAETNQNPGVDDSIEISFNILSPPWASSEGDNCSSIGRNENAWTENDSGEATDLASLTDSIIEDASGIDLESYINGESFETEKVRLRRQEAEARKQSRDWMLDYHMEEEVQRRAPDGTATVKTIVEAYEAVMHHSDPDGCLSVSPERSRFAHRMHVDF